MDFGSFVSGLMVFVGNNWKPLTLLFGLFLFLNLTDLGNKIADAANAFADTYNEQYVERKEGASDESEEESEDSPAKPASAAEKARPTKKEPKKER